MNNLIALLDAALQADLSKRQWAAFGAILRQTLGYRKAADDISAKRLAQLTGIQANHIWQAKKDLVAKGLVHSQAGHYGEILSLQNQPSPQPATPSPCPEKISHVKKIPPNSGKPRAHFRPPPRPKQDTTYSNQDISKPNTTLRWPHQLTPDQRHHAQQLLCGLSANNAQNSLDILTLHLNTRRIQNPLGYLRALVQAARNNTLDTSELKPQAPPPTPPQQHARERQAEWQWLQQMARLQGLPIEVVAAQLSVPVPPQHATPS